ncbi:MAG: P1 family peptidase [Desulfobacterales bacterium]
MAKTGKSNALTDVRGILVGHFTDTRAVSGVTAVLCPRGAVAGVDVRGSAPGTRETDLMAPHNLVEKAQAVVLSGGSVFGLSAADGVTRWLAAKGYGFPLGQGHVVPIVPAAVLYDLGRGANFTPPINADWGHRACENASDDPPETGNAGAGTGAFSYSIKGGLGHASLILDAGITVAALVAVNSVGSVINPDSGRPWEIGLEVDGEFGDRGKRAVRLPAPPPPEPVKNTTIGVIATDASLSAAQAQKVAQMAHDGMARAIRPAHTMFDGDTIFCLATGKKQLPAQHGFFLDPRALFLNELGDAAANCMSRAIIHAILNAGSLARMTAFCDLENL